MSTKGTSTRIRVSCTALARIQDDEGNLALHVSRKGDRTILRPLGGSLNSNKGRSYLITHCGAAQFEDPQVLRFTVPTVKVDGVITWFGTRQLRETGVLSSLFEQLIDRSHVLTSGDARHLTQRFRGQAQLRGDSPSDVAVRDTLYLVEVFDIGVPSDVLVKAKSNPKLMFVSPDEIRRDSNPGGRISSLATCLLIGA
jgi:hypothetical protein